MSIETYIVFPIIRTDFIGKALETLYKYTDNNKFRVIVVDQSIEGLSKEFIDKYIHLYLRQKNAGFARAANQGIIHGLRDNIPYVTVANDDLEWIYSTWWEDLLEEFKTDQRIVAVCPESPRVPMWGYGLLNGEQVDILPYKETFSEEDIKYLKAGDYNKAEIESRYNFTIPASFPFTKRGTIDGIAMWCPVFKREGLIELGLFDERFVWGGMEDYEMLCRAYSCAWPIDRVNCDEKYHRRMVSSMKSWVWHWWGKSKDNKKELNSKLFEGLEPWMNVDQIFFPGINGNNKMDTWGHWADNDGTRKPFRRTKEVLVKQL